LKVQPKGRLNSKDLILLMLYLPGFRKEKCEAIAGRTRITKMLFLFEKEVWPKFRLGRTISLDDLPKFVPHHFGPFSSTVYGDISFLINLGFIEVDSNSDTQASEEEALEYQWWLEEGDVEPDTASSYEPETFKLTPLGTRFVEECLLPTFRDDQVKALSVLKERCTGVTLKTLLEYVYSRYEDFTIKSKIRDSISRKGD